MVKRYQKGNQNLYIKEGQTTRWPTDTKGVIESLYRIRTDNTMAKRYQRGNQNPYIEEELTTQWLKDTKGVNPNPYIEEELTTQWPKDTKGIIRIRISKKGRRHNGQKIPNV